MSRIPVIVVHGGAGDWDQDLNRLAAGREACAAAVNAGRETLANGGSALDAVEVAVRVLEDNPALDAGRGSYPNAHGEIEMDALIMDGRSLDVGAVAAVQRVRYPISLARELLAVESTNFLIGYGAGLFADNLGFPRCEHSDLLVDASSWEGAASGPSSDTVGAVALDIHGNLAAGTSTGGTRGKLPGRVGDSPLVGSGAYADNLNAAASATGRGEDLMKIVISKQVCDFVEAGLSAQEACAAAVQMLDRRVSGKGGIIAVDASGRVGVAYNTFAMPFAYTAGDEDIVVGQ